MSAIYYIKYPNDVHWTAFIKEVTRLRREQNEDESVLTPRLRYRDLDVPLSLYNSRFVGASMRSDTEFDYLEFDSDEDLVVFKLTFC